MPGRAGDLGISDLGPLLCPDCQDPPGARNQSPPCMKAEKTPAPKRQTGLCLERYTEEGGRSLPCSFRVGHRQLPFISARLAQETFPVGLHRSWPSSAPPNRNGHLLLGPVTDVATPLRQDRGFSTREVHLVRRGVASTRLSNPTQVDSGVWLGSAGLAPQESRTGLWA